MKKILYGYISMLAMAVFSTLSSAVSLASSELDRLGFASDVKAEIERESIASQKVVDSLIPDGIGSGSTENSARSFVAMLRDLDGRHCLAENFS